MRFPEALRGGDPRSLGRTGEAVAAVLADDRRFGELFACLGDGVAPWVDRLLGDVAAIDQASVQWHLAQILAEIPLDPGQRDRAVAILKANLEQAHDWIVLTATMSAQGGGQARAEGARPAGGVAGRARARSLRLTASPRRLAGYFPAEAETNAATAVICSGLRKSFSQVCT